MSERVHEPWCAKSVAVCNCAGGVYSSRDLAFSSEAIALLDSAAPAPGAPAARELAVDELLRNFQSACELVGMAEHGDWDCSETTKHRAILRNELRKQLLRVPVEGPRDE